MLRKIILLLYFTINLFAAGDAYVISQRGFFRIRGINQHYTLDSDSSLSEFTVPIELYWPISRETSLYVSTNYTSAAVDGPDFATLSGLSDTQISWNYYLEDKHIVLNAGLGLPTGKSTLTNEEFRTSVAISEHYWNFLVPNLGQGFNLSPAVTWAKPLSDAAVAGLGLAYQIRGSFIPVTGVNDVYKPGNELLLTGGFDFRTGELSSFSLDIIWTNYAADKYNDSEIYKSGQKIVTNVQYKTYIGINQMTLNFRYRSKGKNEYMPSDTTQLVQEPQKTYPNQIDLSGYYRYRHSPLFFMSYGLEGRFYQETPIYPSLSLFGLALMPEYLISKKTSRVGRFKLLPGSRGVDLPISALEIGAGLIRTF